MTTSKKRRHIPLCIQNQIFHQKMCSSVFLTIYYNFYRVLQPQLLIWQLECKYKPRCITPNSTRFYSVSFFRKNTVLPRYHAPSYRFVSILLYKDTFNFPLNFLKTEFIVALIQLTEFIPASGSSKVRCFTFNRTKFGMFCFGTTNWSLKIWIITENNCFPICSSWLHFYKSII